MMGKERMEGRKEQGGRCVKRKSDAKEGRRKKGGERKGKKQ